VQSDSQFEDLETYVLVQRYNQDSSITYELSADQLYKLMGVVGEMEPIIDALNVLNGASVEQRAADIGCSPEDFTDWDDDEIVQGVVDVRDLIKASKIPSWQ
jgi:hypothetical protein